MSSTDSSNEEDNLDLLKEAACVHFMKDSLYKSNETTDNAEEQEVAKEKELPSLRTKLDKDQEYNHLKVTPEFQKYIAKHLSRIIDKQLEENCEDLSISSKLSHVTEDEIVGGVRLFVSSANYLSTDTLPLPRKKKKKRHVRDIEENLDDAEKYKSVSVTSDWITSGEAVSGWEKSARGEYMRVNKEGEIIEHTGIKKKIKTNSKGVRNVTFHIDINNALSESAISSDKKEKMKEKKERNKKRKRNWKN
ncbi:hypothetical protein L9F63_016344 [Diploptera punctata]|uniref:Protein CUSTOS n=1 Tax=Diploptera punctata TaxID=6984 RepID=A0AAD8A3A3_DIPPU|nr:hypothetical protein L9F63_016344 [Diploptera punctata]